MSDLIQIDGSYGEGGGQVLRTSVALAAITGKTVEIVNVRGKRAKPGLQPQHLMAVKAAGEICGARLSGAEIKSMYLRFEPTRGITPGDYRFDIGTAGATSLVLQTVLVPLAVAGGESRVTVTGGTHNPLAPPIDYIERVFLPAVRRMGLIASLNVPQYGFFPKGGGEVVCDIARIDALRGTVLDQRGDLLTQTGRIILSGLPEDVAKRGRAKLQEHLTSDFQVEVAEKPSLGPGAAAFVSEEYANAFAGFTGLGARGKRMEVVAEEAALPLLEWRTQDATVDEHLADQLILPAALAQGESRWRTPAITEHLTTVAWIVNHFLDRTITIESTGQIKVA